MNTEKLSRALDVVTDAEEKDQSPNRPYVKSFGPDGKLLNPIEKERLSTGPNRRERRLATGVTSTRKFSNKRGPQVFTVTLGQGVKRRVHKIKRILQYLPGKTIIHTV